MPRCSVSAGGAARLCRLLSAGDGRAGCGAGASEIYPVDQQYLWLLGRVIDLFGHPGRVGKPLAWLPATSDEEA